MGIREQVKKGELNAADALSKVSKDSQTYGWLQRRINRKAAPKTDAQPKVRKYRSRKVGN